MIQMAISVEQFAKFLDSYKEDYLNSITEISKPREDNYLDSCRVESDSKPLITSNKKMLDFDTICCESPLFQKNNRPSTVDALYYRINYEGKLILYLIEFKGSNLNWNNERSFEDLTICENITELILLEKFIEIKSFIKEKFDDNLLEFNEQMKISEFFLELEEQYNEIYRRINHLSYNNKNKIEFSLRLKAFESIFMVLPTIFKGYWESEKEKTDMSSDISTSDVLEFFESSKCEIQLLVVGKKYYREDKYKYNGKLLYNKIKKQYSRLKFYAPYTIAYYQLFNQNSFHWFLDELGEEDDLKTLND